MEAKLKLNGREAVFEPGQTILEVAQVNGVQIPTLCHLQGTNHTGVCRICVVEVDGSDRLLPACETQAVEGMDILTDSPRVREARKTILEMLVASGQHNCLVMDADPTQWTESQKAATERPWHRTICPSWGDCRLQDLLIKYEVTNPEVDWKEADFPLDDEHPMIVRDFSRCIQCGRCVAACNEVQVNLAIPVPYGRRESKSGPNGWFPVADYDLCVHCGECVQACPVGCLFEKKAFDLGLPNEMERIRTTCPYCGVGCQQYLHVKDQKIVKVTGVEGAQPNQGRLCVKGRFGYDFIYSDERLTTPLIREKDGFREASWDEALDYTANKFKEIIDQYGPGSLAGVSCARSINEDSYQMQKLFRAVFKTNNIDHCART